MVFDPLWCIKLPNQMKGDKRCVKKPKTPRMLGKELGIMEEMSLLDYPKKYQATLIANPLHLVYGLFNIATVHHKYYRYSKKYMYFRNKCTKLMLSFSGSISFINLSPSIYIQYVQKPTYIKLGQLSLGEITFSATTTVQRKA